jgi:hypothetical protein
MIELCTRGNSLGKSDRLKNLFSWVSGEIQTQDVLNPTDYSTEM